VSDLETGWRRLVRGETKDWWAAPARAGLAVLSGLYGGVVGTYRAGFDLGLLRTARVPCRVVSVGNITVGGTGKTTTVRWLVRRLQGMGAAPAVLSYGYRSDAEDPVTVVADRDDIRAPVELTGDEPQLLARSLPGVPILAGRKRVLSARRACEEFDASVCVLDDAFQYWRLEKELEILLVNATEPFGNGHLLPRGELREPLWGIRRAHAAILTHAAWKDEAERRRLRERLRELHPGLVIAEARHRPLRLRDHAAGSEVPVEELGRGSWLALSALGQPESFERTLSELGAREAVPARFKDHHRYTEEELAALAGRVRTEGLAGIVTTEKDGVKIPPGWLKGVPCRVVEIDLEFLSGQDEIERLLRERAADRG
jgi:tetraacyldisaccharide 4'-kinase